MTTCRELIDFLMAYLDNELPARSRAAFDEHLRACGPCRRYLETYKESVRLGREAFPAESSQLPAEVPEQLVRAILEARRRGGGD